MTYCSRSCQKKDWSNGHKLTCCKAYTVELVGQFQGRVLPEDAPSDEREAAKLEELEINIEENMYLQQKVLIEISLDVIH